MPRKDSIRAINEARIQGASKPLPYSYHGTLERVVDGDTIIVTLDLGFKAFQKGVRLRLAGINTPELRGESREEGKRAKGVVEHFFEKLGPGVTIRSVKKDSFGRYIAYVWADRRTSVCLNKVLLEHGWVDEKYEAL